MKVVLIQDIKNIGKAGDIKEVSDGYARNFLLPQKLATPATESAVKQALGAKSKMLETEKIEQEKTKELAKIIAGKRIILKAKEKKGKLFGSITAKNIIRELKKEKIEISEKSIVIESPIKEVGEYEIKIRLDHGTETSLMLSIEKEG
ncbi:MAG: 50S ribosomal protein L9 [Parcubacteria group bacterium]